MCIRDSPGVLLLGQDGRQLPLDRLPPDGRAPRRGVGEEQLRLEVARCGLALDHLVPRVLGLL
eukprot:9736341-Alexandrium_andersonii.AAC.1